MNYTINVLNKNKWSNLLIQLLYWNFVSIYCDQQSWQKAWLHTNDSKFVWFLKQIEHIAGVDEVWIYDDENVW